MSRYIEHFIWGYQEHFRLKAEIAAERLFDTLHPDLDPEVFLVAVRTDNSAAHKKACIEPENHHWIASAELYDVLDDAEKVKNSYPESRQVQSHPLAQKNQDDRLLKRAVRDATLSRLQRSSAKPSDTIFFASFPVERPSFLVMVILSFRASVFNSAHSISQAAAKIQEAKSFQGPDNLIEAAAEQFLSVCSEEVVQPDAGAGLGLLRSTDEILRSAALYLFANLIRIADEQSQHIGVSQAMFDAIARVAVRTYEGALTSGQVLIAPADFKAAEQLLRFKDPVPLDDTQAFRKLLELADGDLSLHCNATHAHGLVKRPDKRSSKTCLELEFTGRGRWSVSIAGSTIMVVQDRLPALPKPDVDGNRLISNFVRVFPSMASGAAEAFVATLSAVASKMRGALIVVAQDAEAEAKRLSGEAILIDPVRISPDILSELTSIDGALLCSPDGNCHAVGVILDGLALAAEGNRGRGARYNSAVRYVFTRRETKTMAVVISEDGGVDVIPTLRPVLKKETIQSQLAEFKSLVEKESTDRRRQAKLVDWFEKHSFYLTEAECSQVNVLITAANARYAAAFPDAPRVVCPPLRSDPDFVPERDLC